MALLRVENLKIRGLPALSFDVDAGECLSVEGPSGSGKTLLLRAFADLDAPDGSIFLAGRERAAVPAPRWRRDIRYVAAEPVWWATTPREQFGGANVADRLLRALGLTEAALDREVATLSTGERQRLALARALADDPQVLLLDEPTSALDAAAAGLVEEHLRFLLLQGRAVLLVSHDGGLISRLSRRRLQLAREPERGPV